MAVDRALRLQAAANGFLVSLKPKKAKGKAKLKAKGKSKA